MSESEKKDEPWNTPPPPSYEEAVREHPPEPSAAYPMYYSYSHNLHQQQQQQQQHTSVQPDDVCPLGTEVLRQHNEILIYSNSARRYKIKDSNKVTLMTAKKHTDGDCCDCCTCFPASKFVLYSPQEIPAAQAISVYDAVNCCSYSPQHMDVMAPVDVSLGTVYVKSGKYCSIVNQSGDQLFYLKRDSDCGCYTPYEIYTAAGNQVGTIDNSRGIKNRLTLSRNLPIRHKILLIFFTLFLQKEEDDQRDN